MNTSPKIQTTKRTFHLPGATDEQLIKYSAKKNMTPSAAIRQLIEQGLSIESYSEQSDLLRKMLREEIETVLDKNLDRIIRIVLKGTKASAAGLFAVVLLLAEEYADEASTENILASALKQSAIFLKQKEQPFEEYIKESRAMLKASKKMTYVDDN